MLCKWFGGDNTAPSNSAAQYHHINPTFTDSFSSTENQRQNVIGEDITITKFRVFLQTAPGVGKSYTITIRKNGSSVGMPAVTISGTDQDEEWTGSVNFSAGDLLGIEFSPSGTPTAPTNTDWHIEYTTTGQKQLILGSASATMPNGATNYHQPNGDSGTSWSTTVGDFEHVIPTGGNLTKLRVATPDGSPGSGKSYDFSVRLNNSSDNLTAQISDAETTEVTTGTVAVSAGDVYVIKEVPTGTPTARRGSWCITFEPTTNGEMIFGFGSPAVPSASATNYEQMRGNGNNGWNSSESVRYSRPPAADYKKLYIKTNDPSPGNRTFTLMDSGSPTALTANVAAGSTTANDTTHTVTHSGGGNTGTWRSTVAASPAASTGVHLGYVLFISQGTLYTQECPEVITIVDSIIRTPGKVLVDVVTIVDTVLKNPTRIFEEVITIVDTVLKTPGKVLADVIIVVDPDITPKITGRTLSEEITIVDTIVKSISRTLDDVVTIVDTVLKTPGKILTDVVTIVDTLVAVVIYVKELVEVIVIVDSIEKIGGKVLSEVITIVDSIVRVSSRLFTETVILVDSIIFTTGRTLSEVITIVDSIVRSHSRTLSEVITIVDSLIKTPSRILTDIVSVSDSLIKTTGRILSEAITLVDTVVKLPGRILSESITLVDTNLKSIGRTLSDAISLDDIFDYSVTTDLISKTLSETVTIADTMVRSIGRTFTETVTLVEVFVIALGGEWYRRVSNLYYSILASSWYTKLSTTFHSITSNTWYTKNNTDWEDDQ